MIKESELILNNDGSIYHLNLKPEHIAQNIIFVGDQNRVEKVTQYFDSIEYSRQKREFKSQTGYYKKKRITVISTGIGPDNIDIVLNELDALVNIDFSSRTIKNDLTSLNIVRIGTSGSLQESIPVDSFLASQYSIALDNMLRSYPIESFSSPDIEKAFIEHTKWDLEKGKPCVISASSELIEKFESQFLIKGFTATAPGFYGPQGRILRAPIKDKELNSKMDSFSYNEIKITNLEMETAAIYGLGKLLGHHCLSLNAIIANRATGKFSSDSEKTIDNLIQFTLNKM